MRTQSSARKIEAVLTRRWWLVVLAAVAASTSCQGAPPARVLSLCEQEFEKAWTSDHTAEVCLASYEASKDAAELELAARAEIGARDWDDAMALSTRLLATSKASAGYRLSSYVLLRDKRNEVRAVSALRNATNAVLLSRVLFDRTETFRSLVQRSHVYLALGEFFLAKKDAEEAISLLGPGDDKLDTSSAFIAKSDALRHSGDITQAEEVLAEGLKRNARQEPKFRILLRMSLCAEEDGRRGEARRILQNMPVDQLEGDLKNQYLMNLAYLISEDLPKEATRLLDRVAEEFEGESMDSLYLRGIIAARSGDLAQASEQFRLASQEEFPDADWHWELPLIRAELADLQGKAEEAEQYYRNAIAVVRGLRKSSVAHAPYLIARHRGPYEGLIALFAKQGRARELLQLLCELDVHDMLRDGAAGRSHLSIAYGDQTPPPDFTPLSMDVVDAVVAAWRGRELAVLIAPSARKLGDQAKAYRVNLRDGKISISEMGDSSTLLESIERNISNPEISRLIVPESDDGETLAVLGIGPLGRLPLGRLQDAGGTLTSQRRPLVRVMALREVTPAASGQEGTFVVASDGGGSLPQVADEATLATQLLARRSKREVTRIGAGTSILATSKRLLSARRGKVFYLAAHVTGEEHGSAIQLDNEMVTAERLRADGFAPGMALLVGCRSGASGDERGTGSLVATLLANGTSVAIATDVNVNDRAAPEIMKMLLSRSELLESPERALAAVQQELHALPQNSGRLEALPSFWGAFVVVVRPPYVPAATTASVP